MISRLRGTLLTRHQERVEMATPGGVVYEVDAPLTVAERLPPAGEEVEILTLTVMTKEGLPTLYGFLHPGERALFRLLLGVQNVGARSALNMLSMYSAPRLARALVEKDVAALLQVSQVGKKTAERLVLELSDKMDGVGLEDVGSAPAEGEVKGVQAAVQALMALGMGFQGADRAVRSVLEDGEPESTEELIRKALARK